MGRPNPKTQTSETEIRNSTVAILGSMGITLFRRNVASFKIADRYIRCGEPGQSDLYGVDWPIGSHWGRPWEIETKRHGKRPTPEQLDWLKASTARGCVAFWGDNVDTIARVAQAVLHGAKIAWTETYLYNLEYIVSPQPRFPVR